MRYFIVLISILFFCTKNSNASWDTLTTFNQRVTSLKTYDNKLFIGGNFTQNEGQTCYWSAYYNGSSITRQTNMIGGSGIDGMAVFEGELYSVGFMNIGISNGFSKWTGQTWGMAANTNTNHIFIYADEHDMFIISSHDNTMRKPAGGQISNFTLLDDFGSIRSVIRYNDKLIFSGTFNSINGVEVNYIVQWDGENFEPLGQGLSAPSRLMTVFNNELYVANIEQAGGQNVKRLARWDGNTWSDVGGGVTGTSFNGIRDMKAHGNKLYVVGDFDEMGNVPVNYIAAWDGNSWSGMNFEHEGSYLNAIEVYNNKLYVGTFDFENSVVYVFNEPVISSIELPLIESVNIYPNPVIDNLFIELKNPNLKESNIYVEIYDLLGKRILSEKLNISAGKDLHKINCESIHTGFYILLLRDFTNNTIIEQKKLLVE